MGSMHIALVCRWYPPHTGFGGVAMHVYYLARALVQDGQRVTVIAARWSPEVPPREEADGIRVIRLLSRHRSWMHRLPLAGRHMRSIVQAGYSIRVMRALRELEKTDPPDVVEFADVEAEGYAYLRGRRRCPVVVRCHTPMFVLRHYYQPEEMPWSLRRIEEREKYCITQADGLTAPSRDMACTIARVCGLRQECLAVIPNALDIDLFARAIQEPHVNGTGKDEVVILHVGRLDRGKGIDVLADAIPLIVKEVPSARFVFIGEDRPDGHGTTWQARLQAKFRDHGVSECVTFHGSLGQEDMIAWYRRAHIAVVPSLIYESFSYTCAQAAAAALPVVASRIGGIPETIEDGIAGLIVEPESVDKLASAIIRLARDPAQRRRMGSAGVQKASRDFAAPAVAQRFLPIYERLAGLRRP
jgi:glycosyltransferase involved in cell wall biosynthesis